jgi:hypothetical protein
MLQGVVLVLTDFSEEYIASIIRVKTISALGKTLAVTRKLQSASVASHC